MGLVLTGSSLVSQTHLFLFKPGACWPAAGACLVFKINPVRIVSMCVLVCVHVCVCVFVCVSAPEAINN